MIELLRDIKEAWDAGGVFIYPIHFVWVLSIAISFERIYFYFFKCSMNVPSFLQQIRPALARGDMQGAIQFCDTVKAPASRLAKTLILRNMSKASKDDVDATIEASLARESHPIERRTAYLAMLANIATLLGLLGTISGLIASFAAAAKIDPAQKAELLATGISEAMNCTAYGLIVAIFSLLMYAFLQGKSQTLLDELKETSFEIKSMFSFKEDEAA